MSNPNSVRRCAVLSCAYRTDVPKFRTQLRIFDRDRAVDCGVAVNIRDIMRQGAQGERILIRVLALRQQLTNEISAANIMHQVAEFNATKWIVAEVLYDGAAVSVGMGLSDLIF